MKILNPETFPSTVLGRECDRCHRRVEMGPTFRRSRITPEFDGSDVQQGVELSKFISLDLDEGGRLLRADFCPACAEGALEALARYLPNLRSIGSRDARTGVRTFDYRAIDAQSDRVFEVSSIIDDGA